MLQAKKVQWWAGFILVILLLLILVGAISWVAKDNRPIQPWEIRVATSAFLLGVGMIGCILVLIRNAVVMNTLFLIKLRDQMAKQGKALSDVERALKQNSGDLQRAEATTAKMTDALRQANTIALKSMKDPNAG